MKGLNLTDEEIIEVRDAIKTPEGKAIVRFDARQHGILANLVAEYEENFFKNYLEDLFGKFQPKTVMENILLERIALHYLKLYRLTKIESDYIRHAAKISKQKGWDQPALADGIRFARSHFLAIRSAQAKVRLPPVSIKIKKATTRVTFFILRRRWESNPRPGRLRHAVYKLSHKMCLTTACPCDRIQWRVCCYLT